MELIKIIWLRADGLERISYEMQAGDMIEASRIFAEMVKGAKEEKEAGESKILGPGSPVRERSDRG